MVVARLVKEASWLGRIENAGIANDTRAFLAFIQRHHGAAFRRVVLSGYLSVLYFGQKTGKMLKDLFARSFNLNSSGDSPGAVEGMQVL